MKGCRILARTVVAAALVTALPNTAAAQGVGRVPQSGPAVKEDVNRRNRRWQHAAAVGGLYG